MYKSKFQAIYGITVFMICLIYWAKESIFYILKSVK